MTAGTNVTLRCQATVSTSTGKGLIREYTILKNDKIVYTKTIGSSEDFVYQLHNARVFSTGLFQCKLDIQGDTKFSKAQRLNVQGGFVFMQSCSIKGSSSGPFEYDHFQIMIEFLNS